MIIRLRHWLPTPSGPPMWWERWLCRLGLHEWRAHSIIFTDSKGRTDAWCALCHHKAMIKWPYL